MQKDSKFGQFYLNPLIILRNSIWKEAVSDHRKNERMRFKRWWFKHKYLTSIPATKLISGAHHLVMDTYINPSFPMPSLTNWVLYHRNSYMLKDFWPQFWSFDSVKCKKEGSSQVIGHLLTFPQLTCLKGSPPSYIGRPSQEVGILLR